MTRDNNPAHRISAATEPRRILIYGISGATWEMIDPLLAKGRLPVLASLIGRGVRATALSPRAAGDKHYRPQIAWPALATGAEPEVNGVTRFWHTAEDIVVPAIWDHYTARDLRVGLFGWPITWPVKPVNGFMVPAYDGRDAATWPAEYSFLRELDRRARAARGGKEVLGKFPMAEPIGMLSRLVKGGVGPGGFARLLAASLDVRARAPAELRPLLLRRARLDLSVDLFLRLVRRHDPRLSAFVTFIVDYAEHRFWMFQDPRSFPDAPARIHPRLTSAVADSYAAADRALGRIIKGFASDTTFVVLSEHGMAAEARSAEIGPWHWVLRPNRVKELVGLDPATPVVPVARWLAFRPPAGEQADVAGRFRAVRVSGTDLPLFQVQVHRDEVIVKLALGREVLPGREELESLQVTYKDETVPFKAIAEVFGRRRSAMHAEEAMLVMAGPGIRHANLGTVRLVDIAPTLLHQAGLEVPADVAGRLLDVHVR